MEWSQRNAGPRNIGQRAVGQRNATRNNNVITLFIVFFAAILAYLVRRPFCSSADQEPVFHVKESRQQHQTRTITETRTICASNVEKMSNQVQQPSSEEPSTTFSTTTVTTTQTLLIPGITAALDVLHAYEAVVQSPAHRPEEFKSAAGFRARAIGMLSQVARAGYDGDMNSALWHGRIVDNIARGLCDVWRAARGMLGVDEVRAPEPADDCTYTGPLFDGDTEWLEEPITIDLEGAISEGDIALQVLHHLTTAVHNITAILKPEDLEIVDTLSEPGPENILWYMLVSPLTSKAWKLVNSLELLQRIDSYTPVDAALNVLEFLNRVEYDIEPRMRSWVARRMAEVDEALDMQRCQVESVVGGIIAARNHTIVAAAAAAQAAREGEKSNAYSQKFWPFFHLSSHDSTARETPMDGASETQAAAVLLTKLAAFRQWATALNRLSLYTLEALDAAAAVRQRELARLEAYLNSASSNTAPTATTQTLVLPSENRIVIEVKSVQYVLPSKNLAQQVGRAISKLVKMCGELAERESDLSSREFNAERADARERWRREYSAYYP